VGATTTLETGKRDTNFFVTAIRVFLEKRCCRHNPTTDAILALSCFFVDKRLLHGVRFAVLAQAIERSYFAFDGSHWHDTGTYRDTIVNDGASATLCQTAAEFRPFFAEIIAQRIEKWHRWIGIDLMFLTVDVNREFFVHITYTLDFI
jgi:hypothetical protein